MSDLSLLRNVDISSIDVRFIDDFDYSSMLQNLVIEVQTSASSSIGWVYQEWDYPLKPTGNWRRLYVGSQLYECDRMNANFKLGFYLYGRLNDLSINVWKPPDISNGGNIGDIKDGFWVVPPDNWKLLNGDVLQRSEYPEFWEWANNWHNGFHSWGELYGLDALTVSLPDCRKDFFRMASDEHPLGERQDDEIKSHSHSTIQPSGSKYGAGLGVHDTARPWHFATSTGTTGGDETRPRNTAINAAIRVKE